MELSSDECRSRQPENEVFAMLAGQSLRFRLTLSFTLILTAVLMIIAILLRGPAHDHLQTQVQNALNNDWAAMKGFLHFEHGQWVWDYDPADLDESRIVQSLHGGIFCLARTDGHPVEFTVEYEKLGMEKPSAILHAIQEHRSSWLTRYKPGGEPVLIRTGIIYGEDSSRRVPYYVAIGRTLAPMETEFRNYMTRVLCFLALLDITGFGLAWLVTGFLLRRSE
jgi:hypothetical protein